MSLPTITSFVHPEIVSSHFHFRNGDRIADFGAGTGFFLQVLSKAVGRDGKVYACEIRKNLVEKMGQLIGEQQLSNVEVIWCDVENARGTKLKDGSLDGGIAANLMFQLEDKESALEEFARVLRKGAKLFVVDWSDSFGGLGPHPDHVFSELQAKSVLEGHGFTFERSFPAGDHHYGLAFRRI